MTKTAKNTLKCILVLLIISVVSVGLLAVANKFLQVTVTLDEKTSALINGIAPTGVSDSEAFDGGHIKMVDLSKGEYGDVSIESFNETNGSANLQILAVYTSTNVETNKKSVIVEVQSQGFAGKISTLIAYDTDCVITGVVVKSQSESYWATAQKNIDKFYESLVGLSGQIGNDGVAALTGATNTQKGILSGVNFANKFVSTFTFDAEASGNE